MAVQDDFKLERYKYILQQIHFLNGNMHKHLAFFHGLAVLILGAIIGITLNWKELGIDAATAKVGIYSLATLLCLASSFTFLLVLSGIFSWVDYRKEEAALLDEVISEGYRSKPKLKNFWRWHESWLLFFLVIFSVTITTAIHLYIVPMVQ
jgi:hypothetical protein